MTYFLYTYLCDYRSCRLYTQLNSLVEDGFKPPTSHQPASIIDVPFVRCTSQQTRPLKIWPSTSGTPLAASTSSEFSTAEKGQSLFLAFSQMISRMWLWIQTNQKRPSLPLAEFCTRRVVTRHGVSTRRLYQLGFPADVKSTFVFGAFKSLKFVEIPVKPMIHSHHIVTTWHILGFP